MKRTSLLLACLFAPLPFHGLTSCAQIQEAMAPLGLGIGPKQTLATEVDELRSMRSALQASWTGVQNRVATVERDVSTFGPSSLAGSDVDLALVSDDILNSSEIQVAEAGSPRLETVDVEAAYKNADAQTRMDIAQVQKDGRAIMSELKQGIPMGVKDLGVDASKAVAKAVTIQLKAQKLGAVAEKNPLMNEADLATMGTNMALIESEVNQLTLMGERIANESSGLSTRMSQAMTTFQAKVVSLKTAE